MAPIFLSSEQPSEVLLLPSKELDLWHCKSEPFQIETEPPKPLVALGAHLIRIEKAPKQHDATAPDPLTEHQGILSWGTQKLRKTKKGTVLIHLKDVLRVKSVDCCKDPFHIFQVFLPSCTLVPDWICNWFEAFGNLFCNVTSMSFANSWLPKVQQRMSAFCAFYDDLTSRVSVDSITLGIQRDKMSQVSLVIVDSPCSFTSFVSAKVHSWLLMATAVQDCANNFVSSLKNLERHSGLFHPAVSDVDIRALGEVSPSAYNRALWIRVQIICHINIWSSFLA